MTNPFLQNQADAITQQATQNLQNNILPGINAGAMMAGGIGGSRQGIAQANAIGQTNQGITNSLAGLYGNAYAQDQQIQAQRDMQQASLGNQMEIAKMNDATSRFGLQNNFDLGMGGLANNWQANQNNFYTTNRGLDLQGMQLGANLFGQGMSGLGQQGAGLTGVGQQQQQAGWQPYQNYANLVSPFTGLGGSQVNTQPGTSLGGGLLGGLLTGAQLGNILTSGGG